MQIDRMRERDEIDFFEWQLEKRRIHEQAQNCWHIFSLLEQLLDDRMDLLWDDDGSLKNAEWIENLMSMGSLSASMFETFPLFAISFMRLNHVLENGEKNAKKRL